MRWLLWSGWIQRRAAIVRRMPIAGELVGRLAQRVLPRHARLWTEVHGGPGRGLLLALPPRVGLHLASGECEATVQTALVEWLLPGALFVDVGANVGFFTLLGARLVGPDGRVVAFEPDPEVRSWLEANVSRNGFAGWVRPEGLAVWRESGQIVFERADPAVSPDRGTGRLARGNGDSKEVSSETLWVSSTSLDDYFLALSTDGTRPQLPDVVKMDLEGAEGEALVGADRLLAVRASVWIVEVHEPPGPGEVLSRFHTAGYDVHVLEDSTQSPLNPRHGSHLLAVPRGRQPTPLGQPG